MKDFDISYFEKYREDNRREVKRANGGLPLSIWSTYSAFANCYGGVIILGIKEEQDGSWTTTGLKDETKLLKDFWNIINNEQKVSVNLLTDDDVEIYKVGEQEDIIMVIYVPMATREEKPVYINNDIFGGTYRRNWEGDYHCTKLQVRSMLRDQTEDTMDMKVLDDVPMEDLDFETIRGYRNRHRVTNLGHPFEKLDHNEFLRCIGAAAISSIDGCLHPTAGGMLMFGKEYNIVRAFHEYFLDYREMLDPSIRWTDRLHSSSGEWSGNICDFYFRVYNKIIQDVKVPFKMQGGERIDDTPVHKALREALANCLINTDFYGVCGVVIKKEKNKLILENPGYIRTGKFQMRMGGKSDPRNKALMKMFNLINIGERAGSGVPNIFDVWEDEGWEQPVIEECYNPDRTVLTLSFKKVSKKNDEKKAAKKSDGKKVTKKTLQNYEMIIDFMQQDVWYKASQLLEVVSVRETRMKELLSELIEQGLIESEGNTKDKKYRKVNIKKVHQAMLDGLGTTYGSGLQQPAPTAVPKILSDSAMASSKVSQ